jgi:hypothetical protein
MAFGCAGKILRGVAQQHKRIGRKFVNSKLWLVCFFIFIGSCWPANGQEAGQILKATPVQLDLGTINEGTPAKATATVINTGIVRVEIKNVRTN